MHHPTKMRSFQRQSWQPIKWLAVSKIMRTGKIHNSIQLTKSARLIIQNTKSDNASLWHSAGKWAWLILQLPSSHGADKPQQQVKLESKSEKMYQILKTITKVHPDQYLQAWLQSHCEMAVPLWEHSAHVPSTQIIHKWPVCHIVTATYHTQHK